MGKLGLDMYLFFIRCEKTCDLPVTREKTVAETSFLCGFRGKGESSNPLTHGSVKKGLSNILFKKIPSGIVKMILPKRSEKYDRKNCYYENQLRIKRRYLLAL